MGSAAGRKFGLRLTTASAQSLRLSERFFIHILIVYDGEFCGVLEPDMVYQSSTVTVHI